MQNIHDFEISTPDIAVMLNPKKLLFRNLGEPKSLRDMRQTWILDTPQTPQQHKRILYNFFLKRNNCLFFYTIIIEFVE